MSGIIFPPWAEMTERRRAHVERVTALLDRWASELKLDRVEATAWHDAGRLHDALRDASSETLRALAPDPQRPVETLHGPAAATRLTNDGETRASVLDAVRHHTTGFAEWDHTGRALYMADFLEPGRKFMVAERAWLAKWIFAVLAFWIVDSLIQYLFGVDMFGIALTEDTRVVGPFKGSLRQPTLIALLLPVALWFALRRGVLVAIAFFVVAGFVATLGGVRMVLVMLLVVAAGFYLRLPAWRFKIPAAIVALAIMLTAIGLAPSMQERMGRLVDMRALSFESIDRLLSDRLTIWHTASNMLRARPFNGVGAGAFAKAYDDYSTRPDDIFRGGKVRVFHAHQVYVAMAAETGLTGLLGLLVAIALCIKWYWSTPAARRAQAWPYALGLGVYFFPLNTQPPMYHGNWLFPILLLLFAALLAALDGQAREEMPQPR